MKLQLFWCAVLLHPEEDSDGKTRIITSPHQMLATDAEEVRKIAIHSLSSTEVKVDDLRRVEVLVRPF